MTTRYELHLYYNTSHRVETHDTMSLVMAAYADYSRALGRWYNLIEVRRVVSNTIVFTVPH